MRTHGFTSAVRPTIPDDSELPANASAGCLAVVTDLCAHGNLEDFMAAEGAPLSVAVKLDLMLQVARGLEALKDARVLWRDLKAKNLLVADVWRGRAGEVTKVSVKFTDWGTAVKMPRTDEGESRRRMTLHGPGTAGYIAPDTRGPMYDYQADMWAYLVWAASMCLTVACVVDCQLEEALAGLRLEKKANATAGHEAKVEAVLLAFEAAGKVEPECDALFELIKTAAPWVDAQLRWTPEEAAEELEQFRGDHALALAPGTRDEKIAHPLIPRTETALPEKESDVCGLQTKRADVTDVPETQTRALSLSQSAIAETAIAETAAVRASTTRTTEVRSGATAALALVDEDASISRRAAAAELRARADLFKREAERLEAEAEAVSEAKTPRRDETSPGASPGDDSELAQRAARTEAALASARWVGATVRVATTRDANRREKSKKSMLRVKRSQNLTSRSTFRTGVIVKTRAAFVGGSTSDPNASGAWAVVCLARFEDGDERELTLAETAACAVDDPTHKVTHRDSSLEADEDAETEPVGSAFVRDAVAETTDIANKRREGNVNVLNVSRTKPATSARSTRSRGAKRAREAEETTSARSLPRRNGRPPLGALSSNEAFRRSEGQVPKPKEPTGTFPGKKEREAPDSSGSGSKSVGSRRGRKAPEWAVRAVETMNVTLGCAKCRQSMYGCGTCRERAGICDPENPPVLALPCSSPENVRVADSGAILGGSARRRGRAAAATAASAAKPSRVLASSRGKRRRTDSDSEEAFVNVGDISDVTTKAELKKRLPRGVKLGCSKCRQCWRGCNACRKANGVWIAPASNWVARGASQSPPSGACLALPAC